MKTRFFLICLIICSFYGSPGSATEAVPFRKVLFLGNSITLHGPKSDIDWSGNWGMAASEESRDYVHLVVRSLTARSGTAPEVKVRNIADFERSYADFDINAKLQNEIDFEADLIIVAIGENVPALKTPEEEERFQNSIARLLASLKSDQNPAILVRSCFWANEAKDKALKSASDAHGCIYVDISSLSTEENNYARSERDFTHAGVANHPGDHGMAAIAEAIAKALPE
jgi:hypothetical protein